MKGKIHWNIEIPGFLGLFGLFAAIWIPGYFWRLFGTSLILWIIMLANYAIVKDKEKKQKK